MNENRTLMAMYQAMQARWGHRAWWPSRAGAQTSPGRLEICVGAILTQNTNWTNVEKALENLHAAGVMNVAAMRAMELHGLAKLIRPAGYFNVKAKRLRAFLDHVHKTAGGDMDVFLNRPVEELRPELLSIHGVGAETADSIILYAAGAATFVVDAYTRRIFARHMLIDESADYERIRAFCQSSLPADVELWNDYHAQIVETGKHHCRPTPRCEGCPLESFPHDATRKPR